MPVLGSGRLAATAPKPTELLGAEEDTPPTELLEAEELVVSPAVVEVSPEVLDASEVVVSFWVVVVGCSVVEVSPEVLDASEVVVVFPAVVEVSPRVLDDAPEVVVSPAVVVVFPAVVEVSPRVLDDAPEVVVSPAVVVVSPAVVVVAAAHQRVRPFLRGASLTACIGLDGSAEDHRAITGGLPGLDLERHRLAGIEEERVHVERADMRLVLGDRAWLPSPFVDLDGAVVVLATRGERELGHAEGRRQDSHHGQAQQHLHPRRSKSRHTLPAFHPISEETARIALTAT